MSLDYIDIFYSHRFDPDTPLEKTMGASATAVKQGSEHLLLHRRADERGGGYH